MAEELISTSKLAARNRANQILEAHEKLELSEEEKKAVRAGAARAWYADLPGAATDITGMALDYGAEGLSRLLPSELAGYDLPQTLGIKRFQKAMRDPALGHKHLEKLGVDAGYIPPTTGTEEEERARLLAGFIDAVPLPVGSMKVAKNLDSLSDLWQSKGVKNWITEKDGTITLHEIVVEKGKRGEGLGTEAMHELIDYADLTGQRIVLTPDTAYGGTSVGRLEKFYKDFGFKSNKGRRKDFRFKETMKREPDLTRQAELQNQVEEPGPTFTSPAVKAVKEIKQDKMPANQWISQMRGRGVNKDELYWTGVEEWLKSKKGSVTKQELDEYLEANQIQVQEVVYGRPVATEEQFQKANKKLTDYINKVYKNPEVWREDFLLTLRDRDIKDGKWIDKDGEVIDESGDYMEDLYVDPTLEELSVEFVNTFRKRPEITHPTKFDDQVLPGGENYRELVLFLPTKKSVEFEPSKVTFKKELIDGETALQRHSARVFYDGNEIGVFTNSNAPRTEMTEDEIIDIIKKRFEAGHTHDIKGQELIQKGVFRESHFDKPNTIAWIRFNERTDADGKRVLFIEEIQSDWAHKGQAEGFLTKEKEEIQNLIKEKNDIVERGYSFLNDQGGTSFKLDPRDHERYDELSQILDEIPSEIMYQSHKGVPAGPFVMDTHQWTALTLKRMVRWAADNDFDSIAWTSGKQQADRYNLSKQVDGIEVVDLGAENVEILAKLKGEDVYTTLEAGVPREKLSDHIGKELADKALKEIGMDNRDGIGVAQFEGIDLELGGDYVKFIYDSVLPAQAKKLGKKYGAKVEEGEIVMRQVRYPSGFQVPEVKEKVWSMNLTDKLKQAATDGLPYYVALPPIAAGVASQAEAEAADVKRPAVEVKTDRILEEALP